MTSRPNVVTAMSPKSWANVFGPDQRARLQACANVLNPDEPIRAFDSDADIALLAAADVLVTCWGAPRLSDDILAAASSLRLVAHAAGSVKQLMAPSGWERGVTVTTAAAENARPVAEYAASAIVFANKGAFLTREAYRTTRAWRTPPEELAIAGNRGTVVGIISASRVGRNVLELLRMYELELWICDPMLDEDSARALGAQLVELDELLAGADVVSVHAPLLPATTGLLDARRLSLMKDGAVFVNTARGAIVDTDALVRELASGRISAIIDTTDPEPLPANHPLFDLTNAFVTPHLAGSKGAELGRLGDAAIREVERFARGEPPRAAVTAADLPFVA